MNKDWLKDCQKYEARMAELEKDNKDLEQVLNKTQGMLQMSLGDREALRTRIAELEKELIDAKEKAFTLGWQAGNDAQDIQEARIAELEKDNKALEAYVTKILGDNGAYHWLVAALRYYQETDHNWNAVVDALDAIRE